MTAPAPDNGNTPEKFDLERFAEEFLEPAKAFVVACQDNSVTFSAVAERDRLAEPLIRLIEQALADGVPSGEVWIAVDKILTDEEAAHKPKVPKMPHTRILYAYELKHGKDKQKLLEESARDGLLANFSATFSSRLDGLAEQWRLENKEPTYLVRNLVALIDGAISGGLSEFSVWQTVREQLNWAFEKHRLDFSSLTGLGEKITLAYEEGKKQGGDSVISGGGIDNARKTVAGEIGRRTKDV